MKKFIKINEDRILLSSIKRYKPIGEKSLIIYYSVSRYRIDKEDFKLINERERNIILYTLDEIL